MESSDWRLVIYLINFFVEYFLQTKGDLCIDRILVPGSRDSSMVESWTHGQKVVGSIPGRGGGQNFSRVNFLF